MLKIFPKSLSAKFSLFCNFCKFGLPPLFNFIVFPLPNEERTYILADETICTKILCKNEKQRKEESEREREKEKEIK